MGFTTQSLLAQMREPLRNRRRENRPSTPKTLRDRLDDMFGTAFVLALYSCPIILFLLVGFVGTDCALHTWHQPLWMSLGLGGAAGGTAVAIACVGPKDTTDKLVHSLIGIIAVLLLLPSFAHQQAQKRLHDLKAAERNGVVKVQGNRP